MLGYTDNNEVVKCYRGKVTAGFYPLVAGVEFVQLMLHVNCWNKQEKDVILAMRDFPTTVVGYVIPEKTRSLLHMVMVSYHFFSIRQEDLVVSKGKLERHAK